MAILNIKVAVLDVKWGKKGNKFAAGTGSKLVCTGFWCSDSNWWQCKNMKEHKSSVNSVCLDNSGLFVISGSLDLHVIISSAFIDKIDEGETSTNGLEISPHGTVLMNFSLGAWVNNVCWSPSNNFAFVATHDSIISVLNTKGNTKDSIYLNHSPASSIVSLSDTEILVISFDRHIYRYKLEGEEWKMIKAITKDEEKKDEGKKEGNSMADRMKMFTQSAKKQSLQTGSSSNAKNIHKSQINSSVVSKDGLITSDFTGFIKIWKY